ncbi:MAG: dihydropteroate synthase [Clostridia bacterium]|nr:dihydropteroate synthase [Clostridia bacterium]MDD4798334.1 dihydropteroate synthase [Clostridia bacterium]
MIIGELLNSSRLAVKDAVASYNTEEIQCLAIAQTEAGADYLDLNCGVFVDDEPQRLIWLLKTVQEVSQLPPCFDSPSPAALAAALEAYDGKKPPLINSISGEKERLKAILPLVKQSGAGVIALCMDDDGIPQSAEARLAVAQKIMAEAEAEDIAPERIFFDPLVQPVATNQQAGRAVMDTVEGLRKNLPSCKMACGLSNISFGLPNRKLLNRLFLVQLVSRGMDTFILNPLDKEIMGALIATRTICGEDAYCGKYLKAHRKGMFE